MQDELVLDPVTDVEGRELSDQDVIDAAEKPVKVTFEHDGMNFMAWVRRSQVTMKQWNRITAIQAKIAFKAGIRPGEDTTKMEADDDRMITMLDLMNSSESLDEAQAEVALAATIRDDDERLLTNVPQLSKSPDIFSRTFFGKEAIAFLRDKALGQAYVKAVLEALRPTSTAAAAAAETTKTASDTPSSESLSSTSPETSQPTG
jgi:hypothetical protein